MGDKENENEYSSDRNALRPRTSGQRRSDEKERARTSRSGQQRASSPVRQESNAIQKKPSGDGCNCKLKEFGEQMGYTEKPAEEALPAQGSGRSADEFACNCKLREFGEQNGYKLGEGGPSGPSGQSGPSGPSEQAGPLGQSGQSGQSGPSGQSAEDALALSKFSTLQGLMGGLFLIVGLFLLGHIMRTKCLSKALKGTGAGLLEGARRCAKSTKCFTKQ